MQSPWEIPGNCCFVHSSGNLTMSYMAMIGLNRAYFQSSAVLIFKHLREVSTLCTAIALSKSFTYNYRENICNQIVNGKKLNYISFHTISQVGKNGKKKRMSNESFVKSQSFRKQKKELLLLLLFSFLTGLTRTQFPVLPPWPTSNTQVTRSGTN